MRVVRGTIFDVEVLYKTTDVWSQNGERCLLWNDPTLAICWETFQNPILSTKDREGLTLGEAEIFV